MRCLVMTKFWRRHSSTWIHHIPPWYAYHSCWWPDLDISSAGYYSWSLTTAFRCSTGHITSLLMLSANATCSGTTTLRLYQNSNLKRNERVKKRGDSTGRRGIFVHVTKHCKTTIVAHVAIVGSRDRALGVRCVVRRFNSQSKHCWRKLLWQIYPSFTSQLSCYRPRGDWECGVELWRMSRDLWNDAEHCHE